jgi:hypothetical protein
MDGYAKQADSMMSKAIFSTRDVQETTEHHRTQPARRGGSGVPATTNTVLAQYVAAAALVALELATSLQPHSRQQEDMRRAALAWPRQCRSRR